MERQLDLSKKKQLPSKNDKKTDSLEVYLQQELERFNRLISIIKFYLQNLIKTIKGEQLMTDELEKMYYEIFENRLPQ